MTSPSLTPQSASHLAAVAAPARRMRPSELVLPLLLFAVTLGTTTAVGMRYMYNFRLGAAPLGTEADILPFGWVAAHWAGLAMGLPFSLTLVGILLAHEFGHYFACRAYGVRATLPYMLPAPSLSGTFGAVIRLRSRVRTRSALMVIGAMGPLAGFVVALGTVALGLHLSTFQAGTVVHRVQAPLLISAMHAALHPDGPALVHIVPHPVLVASWIGILITALNLIPAGQLDGGHIVYAVSPAWHKVCSRVVTAGLIVLGIFCWAGWLLWGLILMLPAMRHPVVPDPQPLRRWQVALLPACLVILVLTGTFAPFSGFSLLDVLHKAQHRYHAAAPPPTK